MSKPPDAISQPPVVELDFASDFNEILRSMLSTWQIVLPTTADRDKVILTFYDAQRRRIPPAPRRFERAADLVVPQDLLAGYDALVAKVEAGDDLTPYLSTRIARPDQPDGLLIDWDIYHLHLGETPYTRDPRFIDRTGPLLFVMVRPEAVYGLAIINHGSWAAFDLLESAHRNFPAVMARYRAPAEVIGLCQVPTESEILDLRRAGIVSMIQLSDGTIYHPPGMGFNSTGRTSVRGSMWRNAVVRQLDAWEELVRNNIEGFATECARQGYQVTPPFQFKLIVDGEKFFAAELNSKVAFPLGQLPGR